MKAGRIHYFGPPNAIVVDEISCPTPQQGELVVASRSGRLFDDRKVNVEVGSVIPLEEARRAHEMLAGAPHKRGKIVLAMQESNGQSVD